MIETLGAVVVIVGTLVALMTRRDPKRPSERPDPQLETYLRRRLEPLPEGLSFSVVRLAGQPTEPGARITIAGVCPDLSLSLGQTEPGAGAAGVFDAVDPRIDAHGRRPLVLALLRPRAREALVLLGFTGGARPETVQMADGALTVDVDRRTALHPDDLEPVARNALAAAALLRAPGDVPARLVEGVAGDTLLARLACLKSLVDEFAGHPATAAALRAAVDSGLPGLQLAAGRALGEPGKEVLLALLRRPAIDDSSFAGAVDALRVIPLALAADLLARSLAREEAGVAGSLTARSVIEALHRAGAADAALLGDAVRSPAAEVALAAIALLGELGTVEAVPLLDDVAAHHASDEVRRRARAAVADVQSRLPGAAPGQLSLSGGEAGAVSLAEDASGRVSLPPAKVPP